MATLLLFNQGDQMGRPTPISLRPHHDGLSWSTDWYGPERDARGYLKRHYKRFGREGTITKKMAQAEFDRWLEEEWKPKFGSGRDSEVLTPPAYTVKEMADDYFKYAQGFYLKDGEPTSMVAGTEVVMKRLASKLGHLPAAALTPPILADFRDGLIQPKRKGREQALTVVTANSYLGTVKRCIKWGMEKGHIEPGAGAGMALVKPLKAGRCAARDKAPVGPVAWDLVEAINKLLPANIAAMVLMQWHTGMRPGEVRIMRPCDIDMSGQTWKYYPRTHKTAHHGKKRMVPIGAHGQAVLTPYLQRKTTAYCFTPNESGRTYWPSPLFGQGQYSRIIRDEAKRAESPAYHPHQIRHSWATRVAEAEGWAAVQNVLGHSSLATTLGYIESSEKLACEVARKVG